jgi:hypothetical protein
MGQNSFYAFSTHLHIQFFLDTACPSKIVRITTWCDLNRHFDPKEKKKVPTEHDASQFEMLQGNSEMAIIPITKVTNEAILQFKIRTI